MNVTVTPIRPSSGRNSCAKFTKAASRSALRMSDMRWRTDRRSRLTW